MLHKYHRIYNDFTFKMEKPVKQYIPASSEFIRPQTYSMPYKVMPRFIEDQYSEPIYNDVIHHSPQRYYNYPISNYHEIIPTNHQLQLSHPQATIPPESIIKVKDDGEVKFESEKEKEEKFEEKFIVSRPPEKKIFEEVVEHEIEIEQPPYVEYEERKVEKVVSTGHLKGGSFKKLLKEKFKFLDLLNLKKLLRLSRFLSPKYVILKRK